MDCGSNYESSILSGHPILLRARLTASRRPLKPAFEVQFLGPQPLAAGAIGSASDSDSEGSRFEAWAASQIFCGYRSKDRTERYERSDWGSTPHTRTKVFGRSSNRTGRSAPNAEIGVGIPTGRPILRCRPTGEALDCRSRLDGFDSRTPRQVFRGCRLTAGSLDLTQRMRVQLSPALPRGCRLIGQDRCLSSSGCGIVTRRPYQVSGYKLCRRSTRLLIERAQFDSVMAHQVVPR